MYYVLYVPHTTMYADSGPGPWVPGSSVIPTASLSHCCSQTFGGDPTETETQTRQLTLESVYVCSSAAGGRLPAEIRTPRVREHVSRELRVGTVLVHALQTSQGR